MNAKRRAIKMRGALYPITSLLFKFIGRSGQAEAQKPSLAVALHPNPLGQFGCFLRVIPEDVVSPIIRCAGTSTASAGHIT